MPMTDTQSAEVERMIEKDTGRELDIMDLVSMYGHARHDEAFAAVDQYAALIEQRFADLHTRLAEAQERERRLETELRLLVYKHHKAEHSDHPDWTFCQSPSCYGVQQVLQSLHDEAVAR